MSSTPNPFVPIVVEGQSLWNSFGRMMWHRFGRCSSRSWRLAEARWYLGSTSFLRAARAGAAVPAFTVEGAIRNITMTTLLGVVICIVAIGLSYFWRRLCRLDESEAIVSITDHEQAKTETFQCFPGSTVSRLLPLSREPLSSIWSSTSFSRNPIALVAAALPILLLFSRFPRVAQVKRWMSQRIS